MLNCSNKSCLSVLRLQEDPDLYNGSKNKTCVVQEVKVGSH